MVTGWESQRHNYLVEVGDILSDCKDQVNVFLGQFLGHQPQRRVILEKGEEVKVHASLDSKPLNLSCQG